METRQINRRLDERRVTITEVNSPQNYVLARDGYGNPLQITVTFHDAVATIPQVGELWYARRRDYDWILDRKAETGTEANPLATLSPGDKRLEATNNLYLSGAEIYFNGTPLEDIQVGSNVGQFWLSAAGMWPSTTGGAIAASLTEQPTNKQNVYTVDFADGATSSCEANVMMPDDWDEGTITASFTWTTTVGNSTSVVWSLQGRKYGQSDLLDQAWGTPQVIASGNTPIAKQLHISDPTPPVTLSGAGKLLLIRVQRTPAHASDSLAADAKLIGVSLSYTRVR